MDRQELERQLIIDEGVRQYAYQDSLGYWTIGVGRCIDRRSGAGLSEQEIMLLLDNDISRVCETLDKICPWWGQMSDARQNVLANMCFNLGPDHLLGFHNFLAALQRGQWEQAAKEMEDSKWAQQIGARASRLAAAMRKG